jgi:hypothetical protein
MMTRILSTMLILVMLCSCDSNVDRKTLTVDEVAYTALKSMKEKDKVAFLALFDPGIVAKSSEGQIDSTFQVYSNLLSNYDLPNFDSWKSDRFFWQLDTVNRIIATGLPLVNSKNTPVDYVFEMWYSTAGMLTGITVHKIADPENLPEDHYPPNEQVFNYSFDSLQSIRVYSLPGINSNTQFSKSVTYNSSEFNEEIKSDFGELISDLNKSEIIGSKKINSNQSTSNDLKAVIFVFADRNRYRNVYLISNNIPGRELELNTFYVTNATYAYQVGAIDSTHLKEDIDLLVAKYLK